MFLCVLARPRYDHHRKWYYNEKIGFVTFAEMVSAKKFSKQRHTCISRMKQWTVNRDLHRSYLTEYVFSALRETFPVIKRSMIATQQNNTRPRVIVHNSVIKEK